VNFGFWDVVRTREPHARMDAYEALKRKYDPDGRALGLYEKCVERM